MKPSISWLRAARFSLLARAANLASAVGADYANPITSRTAGIDSDGAPLRPRPWSAWLWLALFLTALAPRLWVAVRLDTVCNDAVFYIQLAEAYERGDVEAGLGRLRLNTYPPLLALLHTGGLDWETAGKSLGVLFASLAVLPLGGWLRRQFDDRLAVVACLLYAFHPKLIDWSCELVRDPTSWLCWTTALYASWRAASETRLKWYLAAGAAIAFAVHTRFEGWFLYLPLVWWSIGRCLVQPIVRLRAAGGCLAALAVCPLLVVAVNVTLLARQPHWELGNFNRLQYVSLWSQANWQAIVGTSAPAPNASAQTSASDAAAAAIPDASAPAALATTVAANSATGEPPSRMAPGKLAWSFINNLRRGFGVLFGLLWLAGFCCRPRLWLRRDHLVLWLLAGAVATGIWVHLWYAQATSSRYFLALVLLACPCAAVGWCWLCRGLARLIMSVGRFVRQIGMSRQVSAWAACVSIAITCLAGVIEAQFAHRGGRQLEAALGRWILAERGARQHIVSVRPAALVGYYAHAASTPDEVQPAASTHQADVAIAFRHWASAAEIDQFVKQSRQDGLRPVDIRRLPSGYDWHDVVVLEKRQTPDAGS